MSGDPKQLHADPEFQTQVNAALKQFADKIELEALRRAHEGIVEPLVSAGKIVTTATRYDNRLMETVLRARRPAEYREKHEIILDVSIGCLPGSRQLGTACWLTRRL
jgi:hypothetical protein